MGSFVKLFLAIMILSHLVIQIAIAIEPEDILGIWTFENSDGKEVSDLSGNEHNGEIIGNAKLVDGKFGEAIEFTGGHVKVEHTDDMSLETFSLTAWINVPKTVDPYQFVVGKEAWPDRNYSMWIRPDKIVVGFTNGGDKQVTGASVVGGAWHHVASTYDGQIFKVYVDGIRNAQASLGTTPKTCNCPLLIGAQPPNGANGPIEGIIDEVGVFRIALEEDEIMRIMENGMKTLVLSVEHNGKLCATWGALRSGY